MTRIRGPVSDFRVRFVEKVSESRLPESVDVTVPSPDLMAWLLVGLVTPCSSAGGHRHEILLTDPRDRL